MKFERLLCETQLHGGSVYVAFGISLMGLYKLWPKKVLPNHEKRILTYHAGVLFSKTDRFSTEGPNVLADQQVRVVHTEEEVLVVTGVLR